MTDRKNYIQCTTTTILISNLVLEVSWVVLSLGIAVLASQLVKVNLDRECPTGGTWSYSSRISTYQDHQSILVRIFVGSGLGVQGHVGTALALQIVVVCLENIDVGH